MRKPVVLITGAGGEIGHGLVTRLAAAGSPIITLDVSPLDASLAPLVAREFTGSITDISLLDRILAEFEVERVFHLAALLSTRSEFTPVTAHHVNVEGTLNLLEFAQRAGRVARPAGDVHLSLVDRRLRAARPRRRRRAPARVTRGRVRASDDDVRVQQAVLRAARALLRAGTTSSCRPTRSARVDFRCVRFPGLISAVTVPSGGTSDYAPEMIHAAAKGEPYDCFVRPDTTIPFMAMPDGVDALLALAAAPRERLTRTAYNLTAFNPSAAEIRDVVVAAFPDATIGYKVDAKRQGIVDSWPAAVDDSAARRDWGFAPKYDFERAFQEYLIPTIRERYQRR